MTRVTYIFLPFDLRREFGTVFEDYAELLQVHLDRTNLLTCRLALGQVGADDADSLEVICQDFKSVRTLYAMLL